MRVFAATVFALVYGDEKKVPPRTPLQRLNRLNKFANEWVADNLTDKQAANWGPKWDRNSARMEKRFEQCGFFDPNVEHGGPRPDDDDTVLRYDKSNPMMGIKQITTGFAKWAERYVAECKLQPARQVDRMAKWYGQMLDKLAANQAANQA